MSDIRQKVKRTIEAVRIHGTTGYSWFGRRAEPLPPRFLRTLDRGTARKYLLSNLQAQLYRDFYCQGIAQPEQPEGGLTNFRFDQPEFVSELAKANCGGGFWQDGWKAVRNDGDIVASSERGIAVRAPASRVRTLEGPLVPGARLAVHFPKESLDLSPGFYLAAGDVDFNQQDSLSLVRVYWNLQPEGAVPLMAMLTRWLNRAQVPFKLKVLNNPSHFSRCDAAVLYFPRQDFATAIDAVAAVFAGIRVHLKLRTPAFTKELAPGLSVAENPPGGESFGLHRCRILAEGILQSKERGERSVRAALATVERCFAAEGIALDRSYLNPGSIDVYKPLQKRVYVPVPSAVEPSSPDGFLETAVEIGRRISLEAFRYGGRCNWLGSNITGGNQRAEIQEMLGWSLYSGTSGIALVLAELYRTTGQPALRKTAAGAIEQALDRVESECDPRLAGLYTGWPGVALAAARIGAVLGADRLLRRAKLLTDRCINADAGEGEYDLMSGLAGGIIALIILSDLLADSLLLDVAQQYGRALIRKAERAVSGASWRSPAFPDTRNLTGFSHGTAGVAFALLELHAVTGNRDFRLCAEEAFQYERFWYDKKERNWPDFRPAAGERTRRKGTAACSTSWCNGAPGIALSRLRAHQLTSAPCFLSEAVIAAKTTRRWVESCLTAGAGNFSLCHGLAGNAEVLLYGHRVIGAELEDEGNLAKRVAEFGIRAYRGTLRDWPCGAAGITPGLMLGLAGIGYFYLRLANHKVPSVLLPQKEEWPAT